MPAPIQIKNTKILLSSEPSINVHYEAENSSNEQAKLTLPLALGALLAVLMGSLPSGYNIGSVNTPASVLVAFCNGTLYQRGMPMSDGKLGLLWSFAVSIMLMGAIFSSLFSNKLANSFGRKGALLISGCVGIVGSILYLVSQFYGMVEVLLLARLISGLHSGLASGLVPLYIAEISPESLKGTMGVLHTLGLNIGLLTAQILGQESLLGTERAWSLLLALGSGYIVIGFLIYYKSPMSPVYLYVVKGQDEKCVESLMYLRSVSAGSVLEELASLRKGRKELESNESGWTMASLLFAQEYRKLVLLVCLLHIAQQFSGINAVFYYSTKTFLDIGMTIQESQYGSISAVFVNVVSSLFAITLVKRCRRRPLLLTSVSGIIVCLVSLTVAIKLKDLTWMSYLTIALFMAFVCFFALGLGAIPFLIPSELLPQSTLASAMALGGLFNWFSNFTVAISFPLLHRYLEDYVFLVFAVFGVFVAAVIYFHLPETNDNRVEADTSSIISSCDNTNIKDSLIYQLDKFNSHSRSLQLSLYKTF